MNPFEFVIAIVAITTIGQIIKVKQMAKYGMRPRNGRRGMMGFGARMGLGHFDTTRDDEDDFVEDRETVRLREEVKMLKERPHTLERITGGKKSSVASGAAKGIVDKATTEIHGAINTAGNHDIP